MAVFNFGYVEQFIVGYYIIADENYNCITIQFHARQNYVHKRLPDNLQRRAVVMRDTKMSEKFSTTPVFNKKHLKMLKCREKVHGLYNCRVNRVFPSLQHLRL